MIIPEKIVCMGLSVLKSIYLCLFGALNIPFGSKFGIWFALTWMRPNTGVPFRLQTLQFEQSHQES